MHRTWTTAFAVMVLVQGAHAAPTEAHDVPEAHAIIGEETSCREIAPHRADDAAWRGAARRVCDAIERIRQLVAEIAEQAPTGEDDSDAVVQAVARLNETRATCGQPCDDAYRESLSALGDGARRRFFRTLHRASASVVKEQRRTRAAPPALAVAPAQRAVEAAATKAQRALPTPPAAPRGHGHFGPVLLPALAPTAKFGGRPPGSIQRVEPGDAWGAIYAEAVDIERGLGGTPAERRARLELLDLVHLHASTS